MGGYKMTDTKYISNIPKNKCPIDVTRDRDHIHYHNYVLASEPLPYGIHQLAYEALMLQGSSNFRGCFS
jgi:hypothetical protein